jgi:hypothetical protein
MGKVGPFPGVKWQGHDANHSSPSSAKVTNGGAIPPLPSFFMVWSFTFYLYDFLSVFLVNAFCPILLTTSLGLK